MMKLTLSVPLIWMLFSTAEALECIHGHHSSLYESQRIPLHCNTTNEQCLTFANKEFENEKLEEDVTFRTCALSSLCDEGNQSFSLSYEEFRLTASLQCCSTDGCNTKDIPFLDEQKPNGLQCPTCGQSDPLCRNKIQCVGIEDRCIAFYVILKEGSYLLRGCASANLCEGHTTTKFRLLLARDIQDDGFRYSAPTCSEIRRHNSAPTAKLSVISLLLVSVVCLGFF